MSYQLAIYTIYDHPPDFPQEYVIRRFTFDKGITDPIPDKELFFRSGNLQACRDKMLDMGLYLMRNWDGDDPVIVESYI